MTELWHGWNVDHWAQIQTLNRPNGRTTHFYSGYEPLNTCWSDVMPAMPLDIRFESFKRRLASFLNRRTRI